MSELRARRLCHWWFMVISWPLSRDSLSLRVEIYAYHGGKGLILP